MSEEIDIVDGLKALDGDDHTRLECPARYAECTCGYTHRMEAIIPEAASEIQRIRGEVERLTAIASREGDAADAAERDVGRYLYNRLEALVYAGVKCPEMDWIARVIESVEEYGASHCGSDELATFPAPPSKDTAGG